MILVIDDKPDDLGALRLLGEDSVRIQHPEDVSTTDLTDASLILLDYDLQYWPDRDKEISICLQPLDGLALATVLRSHLQQIEHSAPVSFAIYTGEIRKLAKPLPPENREHALAGLVNMDWIFQKSSNIDTSFNQISALAEAVSQLPKAWNIDNPIQQLGELLGLNFTESENEHYLRDIEGCLPPIHELSEWSHGISIIRWMLHRIFPYPTFLLNTNYLAARFRVNPESLASNLEDGKKLNSALQRFAYRGILSKFTMPRWWRSGIEDFLWEITEGKSADFRVIHKALEHVAGEELMDSDPPDFPIICLDENYRELPMFFREEDAVRIRPDHYPSYADQPWISKALAKENPKMRSLVLRDDLELLD